MALSGVTSGQPIVVAIMGNYDAFATGTPSISDNFSTAYTWTLIQGPNTNFDAQGQQTYIYIGTGGAGTSGTVTVGVSGATSGSTWIATASVCSGASTASGLSAVDTSGFNAGGTSTAVTGPSLTPANANEGALYVLTSGAAAYGGATLSASPSSPWTSTTFATGNSVATQPSPTQGTALVPAWTFTANPNGWLVTGILVLPTATPSTQGLMAALM
jgi:hypothetical protein